jgi:hypothetical protein
MPILPLILAAAAAIAAGFLAVTAQPEYLLLFTGGLLVSVFAFASPKLSLVLLIVSMLLSPEMGLGGVSASRSAVLRYDDILLVIVFFSWLARAAVLKNKPFLTETPVQTPMLIYTLLAVASTALGVLRGEVRFEVSVFYVLKYVEYFLLYFMTVNILDSREEMKKYLKYAFVVALLVTVYAYYYYYSSGSDARASAPFEAAVGRPQESEPAALGGYYLLVFGFILAALTEYSGAVFILAAAVMIFMFPAFLLTFSRASYIGFAAMVPVLVAISRKRKLMMTSFFGIGLAALSLAPGIAGKVQNRIMMTYTGQYATNIVDIGSAGQVKLEDSAATRVRALKWVLYEKLPQHPILGSGVTGIGLGDTQYALVLGELGLAGLCVFIWMIYRVFSTARKVYRAYEEPWIKALSLGLMASITGLLFQAVGVNTFILVRVMEPFWFLTALVMALYKDIPAAGKAEAAGADI